VLHPHQRIGNRAATSFAATPTSSRRVRQAFELWRPPVDSTPTCPWRASQACEFWCLQDRYVFKFVTGTKVVADADADAVADADVDTSNDASTYILIPPVAF